MEIRPSFMSEHSTTISRFNIEIPLGLSPQPPLVARNNFFYSPAGWRVGVEPKSPGEIGCKVGGAPKSSLSLITSRLLESPVVCMEDNSFSANLKNYIINWKWRLFAFKVKYVPWCCSQHVSEGFTLKVNTSCFQFAFYGFMD